MLGVHMSDPEFEKEKTKRNRGHTVNLRTDVYALLSEYSAKRGLTKESVVNQSVYDAIFARNQFLKMLAPHLYLEHAAPNALYIRDSDLQKTAVVQVKWNNIITNEKERSLINLKCELCDSDSCIHVRYSLVTPDIIRLEKSGKLV